MTLGTADYSTMSMLVVDCVVASVFVTILHRAICHRPSLSMSIVGSMSIVIILAYIIIVAYVNIVIITIHIVSIIIFHLVIILTYINIVIISIHLASIVTRHYNYFP